MTLLNASDCTISFHSLGEFGVGIGALHGDDVVVSLGQLLDVSRVGKVEAGADGVVAVDHRDVHAVQHGGQHFSVDLLEGKATRVLRDVVHPCFRGVDGGIQRDEARLLQHAQRSRQVGVVIGNGDGCVRGQLIERAGFAQEHAHGGGGHLDDGCEVEVVLFGEALQIGRMLEQVEVDLAVGQSIVRLHVVGEFDVLNRVALLGQRGFDGLLEHVLIGSCAHADSDSFGIGAAGRRTAGQDEQGDGQAGDKGCGGAAGSRRARSGGGFM